MEVSIYLMTNVKSNHPSQGDYIYVLQKGDTDVTLTKEGELQNVTKNQAELEILLKAIVRLNRPCELKIYTESIYLASGISNWLPIWIENGFQGSKGEVRHMDLWQQLAAELQKHKYEVLLKEPNQFTEWMIAQIKAKENKNGK